MKKLHTVELTHEVLVLAESQEDAEYEARRAPKYELGDPDVSSYETTVIPWGWEDDSLVFGADGKTLAKIIEEGHAPALLRSK